MEPSIEPSDGILAALGAAAREAGIPPHEAILLGQCPEAAAGFTASVRDGTHHRFLSDVDWDRLERRMRHRVGVKRIKRTP